MKARMRIDGFGSRQRWNIAVLYRDRHAVRAGWQRDELLEDDALIVAQRLLEIAHADLLVAADLPHRNDAAVCEESRFHAILSHELAAATLEAERLIRERGGEQCERRIGRRTREIADRCDERQRAAADERSHRSADRRRVEQPRQAGAGPGRARPAAALPRSARASEENGRAERGPA